MVMSLDDRAFDQLVDEIMSLGYDEKTACEYAARIGDTPTRDQDDNVLVLDRDGKVLAKLKLKFFDEE